MKIGSAGRILTAVIALAAVLAFPGVAGASPSPVESRSGALPAGKCWITRGDYTGGRMCGSTFYVAEYQWPDGRLETFIVGWDRAIYHIWQASPVDTRWSGWESLGGGFIAGPHLEAVGNLTVWGGGLPPNTGVPYCKQYTPGGWSPNWYSSGCSPH